MSGDIQMLPGLEDFAKHVDRAGANDLSDPKRYTAMTLLRDYPDVYRQAARALFYYRLPCRTVKDLFRLSFETVQAIRDQVMASQTGAASFFTKLRTNSQRDIVQAQLLDAIQDRLSNPDTISELDTSTLVGMLATLDKARPASNGVDAPASRTDVTVVSSDDFDQALDGLSAEKNPAAIGCGDSVVGDGDDGMSGDRPGVSGVIGCMIASLIWCSTWHSFAGVSSLQLSYDKQCLCGICDARCNSWCNSRVTSVIGDVQPACPGTESGSTSSTAPVTRVSIHAHGGRGAPGGGRARGVN